VAVIILDKYYPKLAGLRPIHYPAKASPFFLHYMDTVCGVTAVGWFRGLSLRVC